MTVLGYITRDLGHVKRGFQPTQRTQGNRRNATNAADGTDATTASIIAFWPLRQLRLLLTFSCEGKTLFILYFLLFQSLHYLV